MLRLHNHEIGLGLLSQSDQRQVLNALLQASSMRADDAAKYLKNELQPIGLGVRDTSATVDIYKEGCGVIVTAVDIAYGHCQAFIDEFSETVKKERQSLMQSDK